MSSQNPGTVFVKEYIDDDEISIHLLKRHCIFDYAKLPTVTEQKGLDDLLIAAKSGDLKAVEKSLENGANVNCTDKDKNTPLHVASRGGFVDVAELLISKGADIHSQDDDGDTPLHYASEGGFVDVASLLISKGADIHSQDDWEDTPLHMASRGGFVDVASLLISKGADIHSRDPYENTPLHYASRGGFVDVASLLISKGADIHSQNDVKDTPLHDAAWGGFVDVASLLISKGADIHSQGYEGQTALKVAKGKAEILLQLVESGVNVSHALEAAKHCGSLTEAQVFIQSPPLAAATVPINMPPDDGVQQIDQDIILPGIDDAKEFKSLLKLGTYEAFGNRIYLGGACSVGKSTLASLLIGDEIPLEWKSTDGLKIFFGRNGIHLEEKKMVPLDKDTGNTNILSSVLRGHPDMNKCQPDKNQSENDLEKNQVEESFSMSKLNNNATKQNQPIPLSTDIESTQSELHAAHSLISDVHDKHHSKTEKMKMHKNEKTIQQRLGFSSIHEDIKQEIKKGEYKVKIAPSDLVDFGGQKSYDMTHQLFIQGKGTFTLLFDGRKGLHDPLPEYPQGNVTSALILKHWVDSILTYCGEDDDDILPVILFAATHRDKLSEDKQKQMVIEFQQGLKDMFQNHERANRIKYNDIFFINGTDRSDAEVNRLQTTYVNIAFQQKSWGERMPLACVPLELQMSEMRSSNINIISKDDLIQINEENDDLALTNKELDDFLQRQHVLGKIMYFKSQGLKNFIILEPTALVDILRSFITDEMFFPSDTTLRQILNEMTKTGKIRKEDLFKLWKQDEFNRHMPDDNVKAFVVKVLIHLDLLIEPKRYNARGEAGEVYLVPCIIRKELEANFLESLKENKTLYLSYKLLKSSIPSALSFKIIGSALNVWPLKETEAGDVCLYSKAAILRIDQSNELYILVRDNRVFVCLQNVVSKQFISPDIASCIQECLTLTIENALKFYHSSFGKLALTVEITKLFNIEVGHKCRAGMCYLTLSEAKTMASWKCMYGTEHETKYPLYWTFDKEHLCKPDCTGLDQESFKLCPTEKHLARLAQFIGPNNFGEFVIRLGFPKDKWEDFEYRLQRGISNLIKIEALCAWKIDMDNPSFKNLNDAITAIGYTPHKLCQIFRENRRILDIDHPLLQTAPEDVILREVSCIIGNCAVHLGVELGLDFNQIEDTTYRYNKNIFDQNYDILMKWKNKYGKTTGTLRTLMHVLYIVDKRGCTLLKEKYGIDYL